MSAHSTLRRRRLVALVVVCVAAGDAVAAVADERVELTAFATEVFDPVPPSFDSKFAKSVRTVFVELLLEREFQLMPILKLTARDVHGPRG